MTAPVRTKAQRAAALENGFLVEREQRLLRAFKGKSVGSTGSAVRLRSYFILAGLLVLSASGPLLFSALVAVATAPTSTTIAPLTIITALITTNLIHELGHLIAFALVSRSRPHVHLVARFGFAHIVRPELSPTREIFVIVAGPCCVAIGCCALIPVAPHPVLMIVLAAIGAGHLATLVLPIGDGANLRDALRRTRARR